MVSRADKYRMLWNGAEQKILELPSNYRRQFTQSITLAQTFHIRITHAMGSSQDDYTLLMCLMLALPLAK